MLRRALSNQKGFSVWSGGFWIIGLALLGTAAHSEDWPCYLHDNSRSGVTSERLDGPLGEQWAFTPRGEPVPAWTDPKPVPVEGYLELPKVRFDDAYHVAVADGLVFFACSAENQVVALDAATGQVRWSFFTGAPPRLAPAVQDGRVFFGADDGFVYCLSAAEGRLLWKFQAAPEDRRVLGHGRMMSLWPVRTGVLVDGETVYFGAGIFPAERVYLYAVRAEDGQLLWKNDTVSDQGAGTNGFSPQGYLLASATNLFAPSGRNLPACFDRQDGRFVRQFGYGKINPPVGGTYALLADDHLFSGTGEVVEAEQKTGSVGFAWFPGRRLVVTPETSYLLTDTGISALNRKAYPEASRKQKQLQNRRAQLAATRPPPADLARQLQALDEELKQVNAALAACRRWQCPLKGAESLILAGDTLFVGGAGEVMALDAASGRKVWTGKVDGAAKGLAAAGRRLFVSTDQGAIHCFGPGEPPTEASASVQVAASEPRTPNPEPPNPPEAVPAAVSAIRNPQSASYPRDHLTGLIEAAAEAIVKETGVTKGYCLILGCGTGRLAYELAKRTDLRIYGLEPDANRVEAVRAALDAVGVYGTQVAVDGGDLASLPYPDYFANLIVSETALVSGRWDASAQEVLRVLKPCGGTLYLGQPAGMKEVSPPLDVELLKAWLAGAGVTGTVAKDPPSSPPSQGGEEAGAWLKFVRGPLEGAGTWSHQYGEPGNTSSSADQLVKCPLGVLWFGEPGPDRVVTRHEQTAAPLVVNGRVFLQGELLTRAGKHLIMAFDAYNGVVLWERHIPGANRTNMIVECSNLAANEDSLFVTAGAECLRLDAATGETRQKYALPAAPPDGRKRTWGYVAVVGDLLYGSTAPAPQNSDALFARDVESGDLRWVYRGKSIKNNTIALSEGRLFFADNAATSPQRQAVLKAKIEELRARKKISVGMAEKELASADVRVAVALDAATGEKCWEKPVDLTDCGSNVLCAMAHQGVLLFCGAFGDGHYWPQFLANEYVLRRAVALSTEDGRLLWSKAIGYRIRPLIIGDTLYAEPWAFDLHTGEQQTRPHPLTGQPSRWEFERPGHHCGPLSGSPNALFFRSASIAYYDLATDQGTYHFAGQRPGCWINTIPASGLVVIPEASSGCVCAFSIHCTVVLQPRPTNKAWGAFDAPGETLPVQHLAVNLGGPGDRKDDEGKVWFSFPRPWGRLRVNFSLAPSILPGGGYFSRAPEHCPVAGTDAPWLFASGCAGLRSCSVPLVGEADGAALYRVRLGFCDGENDRPGQRVFDIKLQGQTVAQNFDPLQAAGGPNRAVFQEFSGVEVGDKLTIELVPKVANPTKGQVPLLNTLEVTRLRTLHVGLAAPPSFLLSDLSRQQARPVKLANRTDAEFQGTLRLIAPAGFSVTPGETPVRLAPNEQRTLDVTAAVATPGQPGDYFLEVSLVRPDGTVESQRRARLEYLGPRGRLVIKAAEDAYMQAGGPETNRGHEASLLVDGGNQQMGDAAYSVTYLKFPLNVPGKPISARLRLRVSPTEASESGDSGNVYRVDQPWEEYQITYANRPKPGPQVAKLGQVGRDVWEERPLDVDLAGKTELSLAIEPTTLDGATYYAREGGQAAELVVDYEPTR